MDKRVKLSDGRKELMRGKIVEHFSAERDEDLGQLASQLILDFIIDELGADFYNQGVEDAHAYVLDKLEDLYALQIKRK